MYKRQYSPFLTFNWNGMFTIALSEGLHTIIAIRFQLQVTLADKTSEVSFLELSWSTLQTFSEVAQHDLPRDKQATD